MDHIGEPLIGEVVRLTHCQACGSVDPRNVGPEVLRERQGYTACCNERAIYPGQDVFRQPVRCGGDCYHR